MPKLTDDAKTTAVSVRVTQPQGGNRKDGEMQIWIEDRSSGVRVAEITIDAVQFINMLSSRSGEASCVWRGLDLVGKQWEVKDVFIDPPDRWGSNRDAVSQGIHAAVEHELTDGWFVFSDGLSSQQAHDKHRVVLGRHVERGEGRWAPTTTT